MNRLRDEIGSDSISQRGIEILREVQPSSSSPDLRRRVWASLQRAPFGAATGPRHSGWKAFALGITSVVIAATAGAAIGSRWSLSAGSRPGNPTSARPPRPQHGRGAATRRLAHTSEGPQIVQETPSVVAAVEPPRATARQSTFATFATFPTVAAVPAVPTVRTASQAPLHKAAPPLPSARTEVLDALIALRRDHDAERAAGLLDSYLTANKSGALREEALVLAIEAADARHDQVRARVFAGAYQIEFPGGRFAPFARHHLIPTGESAPPQ